MTENVLNRIEDQIPFRPVRDLLGLSFKVRDYQRGYKWGAKEILELLNDINEHNINDGKYCLQPIIVRETDEHKELIDGQQRVTSIYLILAYLTNSLNDIYSISYETREESKEFLSTKILELNQCATKKLPWEDFIKLDAYAKYDNVDIYHFYTVYSEIVNWFETHSDGNFKRDFLDKIKNTVHVIWYDIDKSKHNSISDMSAETIFLNLNAGKIPLTSSELIKALFILKVQKNESSEIAKLKSTELALEWDQIENKLHDDSFWFFICDNEQYNSSSTRIDFLIDIVNNRDLKKHDDFYSYRAYETKFKEDKDLDWPAIKNTFNKLAEWYESKELYHYVGFLIVSGIKTLNQILEKSKGISKPEFKDALVNWIKTEFKKTKVDNEKQQHYPIYGLEYLDFQESRKECERVLLLLNILYYIKNRSDNKFPFELYKKETWSVEHINPQNPRDFDNVGDVLKWLQSNKSYYNNNKVKHALILTQLESVSKHFEKFKSEVKRKLSELKLPKEKLSDLDSLIEAITTDLDLHGIANLALLDKNSNSRLSNKLFLDKRKLILQFDKDGKYNNTDGKEKNVFIPVCTKNVFSKIYTTEKDSLIDSFFGKKDLDAYFNFIETELYPFYN